MNVRSKDLYDLVTVEKATSWSNRLAFGVLQMEVYYDPELECFQNNSPYYGRAVTELYEEMYAGYGY